MGSTERSVVIGAGATAAEGVSKEGTQLSLETASGETFTRCSTMARGRGFGEWWDEMSGTRIPRNIRNRANMIAAAHTERCLRALPCGFIIADSLQHVTHEHNISTIV